MRPRRADRGRAAAPVVWLLLAIACAAIAVDRLASPAGGLRLARGGPGQGRAEIRTGPPAYPREARDSDSFVVRVARPVRRVASQYWSLDEFVYSVVPPERVVAVSESAYLKTISNAYRHAERHRPAPATDPERVLRASPDLVVVSNGARLDYSELVRNAGVPVYRAFVAFTTLEEVAETIRLTGYLTGEDAAADAEIRRFRSEIERARARRPANAPRPRILGLGGRSSYGAGTLFDEVVRTLGGINVGAEGGLKGYDAVSTEQIARWDPEWIVTGADAGKNKEVLARLLADPGIAVTQAARNGRVLVFDFTVFLPMSPFTTLLVAAIAEAIYG